MLLLNVSSIASGVNSTLLYALEAFMTFCSVCIWSSDIAVILSTTFTRTTFSDFYFLYFFRTRTILWEPGRQLHRKLNDANIAGHTKHSQSDMFIKTRLEQLMKKECQKSETIVFLNKTILHFLFLMNDETGNTREVILSTRASEKDKKRRQIKQYKYWRLM